METNLIKMLIISLFSIVVMGCTISTPILNSGSYEGLKNTDPNKGTIFVYRESAFVGGANQFDVMVNGVLVGSLPSGSFFSLDAAPGENKIEPRTLTSFSLGKGSSITVEKGKSYCLKLTTNFCFGCKSADINLLDKQQCENEIKSLKKVRLE